MSEPLFERLWDGSAPMEAWTESRQGGVITEVADGIIAVHSTYFCGSVTAIRTAAGLVVMTFWFLNAILSAYGLLDVSVSIMHSL